MTAASTRLGRRGAAAPRPRPRPAVERERVETPVEASARPARAVAGPTRVGARARPRRRAGAVPSTLVVLLVGLLLGGIVSLQVAALRANMAAGDVRRETRRVAADIGNLEAAIAKETTPETIEAAARRMGMVYAPADAVRTVRIRRAGTAR